MVPWPSDGLRGRSVVLMDREQIEAELAAITPGPWLWTRDDPPYDAWDGEDVIDGDFNITEVVYGPEMVEPGNARFIAHAPDTIRVLLDENKRLHDESHRLRLALVEMDSTIQKAFRGK